MEELRYKSISIINSSKGHNFFVFYRLCFVPYLCIEMKFYFLSFVLYVIILPFLLGEGLGAEAFSQSKKVELLHANSLEFDEKLGKDIKRLIGNVQFKHEGALMYCDSAYLYPDNSLDAFSNVRIQQGDSLNLYGQFLKYNGNTRMAEVQKNIRLVDKGMTLTTELLYYDMKSSLATYPSGGTIVSKQNTLTSKKGYYNPQTKAFSFKDNVVLTNPEYVMNSDTLIYNTGSKTSFFMGPTRIKSKGNNIYCEYGWYNTDKDMALFSKNAYILTQEQKLKGDSISYDQKNRIGKAYGNVSIIDTVENIITAGDFAIHNEKEEKSFVTGHALLKQFFATDTLFLHADTLCAIDEHPIVKGIKDTSVTWRKLFAYHHVKFFRNDIQGKCDSLVYSYKDSIMRLYKEPVLWSDKNQLTAEKVELKMSGGEIKNMFLKTKALIVSKEDTAKFNQIKGKEMTGYFRDNKLVRIFVEGNGQTIYFAKDKNSLIGINKAECSNLMIFIKENKVDKITFLNKPDATMFPMSDFSPKEFLLKDFVWREMERPFSFNDIFR